MSSHRDALLFSPPSLLALRRWVGSACLWHHVTRRPFPREDIAVCPRTDGVDGDDGRWGGGLGGGHHHHGAARGGARRDERRVAARGALAPCCQADIVGPLAPSRRFLSRDGDEDDNNDADRESRTRTPRLSRRLSPHGVPPSSDNGWAICPLAHAERAIANRSAARRGALAMLDGDPATSAALHAALMQPVVEALAQASSGRPRGGVGAGAAPSGGGAGGENDAGAGALVVAELELGSFAEARRWIVRVAGV